MAFLESGWLDRQRGFFLTVLRAMVGYGEEKTGNRAELLLVAKPDRFTVAAALWTAPPRLGLYLRVRIHLDSLYSQSDHQLSHRTEGTSLRWVFGCLCAALELLFSVRVETDGGLTWMAVYRWLAGLVSGGAGTLGTK